MRRNLAPIRRHRLAVPIPRQATAQAQVAAAIVAAVAVRAVRMAVAADRIVAVEVLTAAVPTATNSFFDPKSPLLDGSGLFLFC